MKRSTILRTTGLILLSAAAMAALGALVVRDQIERHQRDLFSPRPLKRLAALGYISGLGATVELARTLRDFITWEERTLLRRRAKVILHRMEGDLERQAGHALLAVLRRYRGVKPDSFGFLGVDDVARFDELLTGYVQDSGATCALLCDRTGRLLTSQGDTAGLDGVTFASLAAGDFGASDQLAALLGETEFTSLYHHGEDRSMFLADLAGTAILAVLFDNHRTTLGMVRIRTRTVVPQFVALFEALADRGPAGRLLHMEAGWAAEAESEVDRLFNDI